jgi:hypothetical protein
MKMRQALLTPVALSVLLALAGAPASAQDATTTDTSLTTLETSDTSTALATSSAVGVSIKGIVSGKPESVAFSGQAQIKSRLVRDPDFNRPSLLLTIDLGSVSGVGSSTSATYVIPAKELVQRGLAASQLVEITFPFLKSSSTDLTSARSGVASFALDFNVDTGEVTNARAKISSPNF